MAEGDKFERRLRGLGWRKVYQLGRSGAKISLVVDAAVTAVSRGLRKDLECASLGEILSLLQFSLQTEWKQKQSHDSDPSAVSPLSCLCAELERVEQAELGSITAQIASDVAQSVFAELNARAQYPTHRHIQDAFAEELVWRIVDNRCLSHVREGIALGTEHTSSQQERWEREVRKTLRGQALKLFNQMVKQDGSLKVARAPRRLTPKIRTTKELLHQPLQTVVK
jgi:hypothetical protein